MFFLFFFLVGSFEKVGLSVMHWRRGALLVLYLLRFAGKGLEGKCFIFLVHDVGESGFVDAKALGSL